MILVRARRWDFRCRPTMTLPASRDPVGPGRLWFRRVKGGAPVRGGSGAVLVDGVAERVVRTLDADLRSDHELHVVPGEHRG